MRRSRLIEVTTKTGVDESLRSSGNVTGVAVENGPADARRNSGAATWGSAVPPTGSKIMHRGGDFRGPDSFQDLRALGDRVIIRVEDLSLHAEIPGACRGLRLFDLIIVVARGGAR